MMERVALVTGVGGGIGMAVAKLFFAQGWKVIGVDQKDVVRLPEGSLFIQTDCALPGQILKTIRKIAKIYGRLDALVNNAAVQVNKPAVNTSLDEWDKVLDVNLRAAFLFSKESYSLLKNAEGSVVNVSSVHAVATSINICAYAASKGGLVALTRALAIEWAPEKIRVNAVLPGAVDTPMLREGLIRGHLAGSYAEELVRKLGEKTVMGRIARPEEIAQAVLFLADSQRSSFITGQSLIADGGATIRLSTE